MNDSELDKDLAKARRAWLGVMHDHRNLFGIIEMPVHPVLAPEHLANCRVHPLREHILDHLPTSACAAEVGVKTGIYSETILERCQPRELHLIDTDLTTYLVRERFEREIDDGRVIVHETDSVKALSSFDDAYFDFIYIDADHSYVGVSRDISIAKHKVKQDGMLLFNDYAYWSPAECQPYGVLQAVNELCIEDDWEVRHLALGYMGYADVALQRRSA